MKQLAALAVFAVFALGATPARADPPVLDPAHREEAARLVTDGSARYDARDYQGALDRYDRAYQLYPAPKLHYNRALALEGLRRAAEAADEYARFIADANDAPPAALAHAGDVLAELEKRLGKLAITSNVPGAVAIDDRTVGATPVTAHVAPGLHQVRVTGTGRKPWREAVDVAAGATVRRRVELAPLDLQLPEAARADEPGPDAPERVPAPAHSRSVLGRWWFWGVVGAAVATGAALTYAATRSPRAPDTELGTVKLNP